MTQAAPETQPQGDIHHAGQVTSPLGDPVELRTMRPSQAARVAMPEETRKAEIDKLREFIDRRGGVLLPGETERFLQRCRDLGLVATWYTVELPRP
jgi:hypothetical protein